MGFWCPFHCAHGLFFHQSNAAFNLILPVRMDEKMTSEIVARLLEKGQYWCAFSKASMRTLSSNEKLLIRLFVIFIEFNEEGFSEVRFQLKEVVEISHSGNGVTESWTSCDVTQSKLFLHTRIKIGHGVVCWRFASQFQLRLTPLLSRMVSETSTKQLVGFVIAFPLATSRRKSQKRAQK